MLAANALSQRFQNQCDRSGHIPQDNLVRELDNAIGRGLASAPSMRLFPASVA